MVDGNALAGELSEVFSQEMTVARVACGGCGAVEQLRRRPRIHPSPRDGAPLLPLRPRAAGDGPSRRATACVPRRLEVDRSLGRISSTTRAPRSLDPR